MSHSSKKLGLINTGKVFDAPKSFTAAETASLGLKGLSRLKTDRPLGRVLFYALVSCLNIVILKVMKVKDLQHCF